MNRIMLALSMWGVLAVTAHAAEVPDVVLRYADAFARTHPDMEPLPPGKTLHGEYARHFLDGYLHQSGDAFSNSPMIRDAHDHGLSYWRNHPSERDTILAGYGYVAVDLDGVWSRGFESIAFIPSNENGERWWMSALGADSLSEVGLDGVARNGTNRVHVVGYVSPGGHYGHLGMYPRELLVTSGELVDTAPSSSKNE